MTNVSRMHCIFVLSKTKEIMKTYTVNTTDGSMSITAKNKKEAWVLAEKIIRNDGGKEKIINII